MTAQETESQPSKSQESFLIMSRDLKALRRARSCLTSQGLSVMTASTLDEALQLYRKNLFGVIFLDTRSLSTGREKLVEVLEFFFSEDAGLMEAF